ncbi:MAG: alpha/beta hydrolase [Actinobacteria bacterium]|nr:alpha/beta hydrolase [Actinomycetota bacterium]
MVELIRPSTVLPASRQRFTLKTADRLTLIGEVAIPVSGDRSNAILCLHPLPTHGGMMDSHIFKKAANRLPALADITVIRFNTRGTSSEQGTSEGTFGHGISEKEDKRPIVALVPELDDYLQPDAARQRFSVIPSASVIAVEGAKHLWVGEPYVHRALTEITRVVNPSKLPLPLEY